MIQSGLDAIINLFQSQPPPSKKDVFNEAVLMTLARATSADSNIKHVEVETVQEIVKQTTGEEVSVADVRVVANSHLFETAPIERYLATAGRTMTVDEKIMILNALVSVIKSDERVTPKEISFFQMVSHAFNVTTADVLGLRINT